MVPMIRRSDAPRRPTYTDLVHQQMGRAAHAPDLDDPARYRRIPAVPLLDVHADPSRGDVDAATLHRLAANSNRQAEAGHYTALLPGHPRDDVPEHEKPAPLGFVRGYSVGTFDGRACLMGDTYIDCQKLDYAMTFPYRSVGRVIGPGPGDDVIDHVSLLRHSAARPLGIVTYSRPEGVGPDARVVRYAMGHQEPFYAGGGAARPIAPEVPGTRGAIINFAVRHGIRDFEEAARQYRGAGSRGVRR